MSYDDYFEAGMLKEKQLLEAISVLKNLQKDEFFEKQLESELSTLIEKADKVAKKLKRHNDSMIDDIVEAAMAYDY